MGKGGDQKQLSALSLQLSALSFFMSFLVFDYDLFRAMIPAETH